MPKGNSIFIKEALRDIRSVGTMVASGKRVARALLPSIKKSDPAKVIVELGLGTGGYFHFIRYILFALLNKNDEK